MGWIFLVSLILVCGASHGQVFQPPQISLLEGDPVHIKCQQNVTSKEMMMWYKQDLEGSLGFLGTGFEGSVEAGTFTMTFNPNERSTSLKKTHAEPSDAATYYCAVRDTVVPDESVAVQKLKTFTIHKC